MEFNSLNELKERVMPALEKRASDLTLLGYDVTSLDIWDALKIKWVKRNNLTLNEIVNDILTYEEGTKNGL